MCDSPFVLTPQAVWIACNKNIEAIGRKSPKVSIPQAVWIACNNNRLSFLFLKGEVSIPQAVWIACNVAELLMCSDGSTSFNTASGMDCMQFVWMGSDKSFFVSFNTASGMDCMQCFSDGKPVKGCRGFNTASGMDCMQYRPSQPLGQLNPEAGFLNGSLFLANRRNLAGFFCRQNRLKTSANPVISRKLLSTGKI